MVNDDCCVIVPVHNGAATLPACLRALRQSDPGVGEILVVDDGSTDGSAAIAREFGCRVVSTGPRPIGPGLARNHGAKQTSASILVFVDSDVAVHRGTLERLVAELRREADVGAVFGSYDADPPSRRASSVYANLRHHHVHQNSRPEAETFWAGCGAVRRSVLERCGGFSQRYGRPSIEDIELGMRIRAAGYRIRLLADALSTHHKDWRIGQVWKTDVFQRAIPWSRLLVGSGGNGGRGGGAGAANDLNTRWTDKASAVGVHAAWWGVIAAVLIHPAMLWTSVAGVSVFAMANLSFWRLVARGRGLATLAVAVMMHAAYLFYSSVVYAVILGLHRWSRLRGEPLAKTLAVMIMIGGIAIAATAAMLAIIDTASLSAMVVRLGGDLPEPLLTPRQILLGQRIAGAGAFLVLTVLPILWLVLPAAVSEATTWSGRKLWSWTAVPTTHRIVLMAAAVLAAYLIAQNIDQPYRSDEALTFLTFGQRHPLAAICVYHNPNNHMLHSLLMRGSIALLGDTAPAVRLPAALAAWLCVLMIYPVGCRYGDPAVGLLAASLMAGLPWTIELATNARGYPIVVLCTLVVLYAAPEVAGGRPGGSIALTIAAVVGAWAVPIMIYPFAIAVLTAVLLATPWFGRPPRTCHRRLNIGVRIAMVVAATGLGVMAFYSPALIVSSLRRRSLVDMVDNLTPPSRLDRIEISGEFLSKACDQMIYPASGVWQWLVLGLIVHGGLALAWGGPRGRCLVIAACSAPLAVWSATGFRGPPWWSLGFLAPIALILLCVSLGSLRQVASSSFRSRRLATGNLVGGVTAAWAVLILAAAGWAFSPRPYWSSFPHSVGLRGVDRMASVIGALPRGETVVMVSAAYWISPLRVHLNEIRPEARIVAAGRTKGRAIPDQIRNLVAISYREESRLHRDWREDSTALSRGLRLIEKRQYPDTTLWVYVQVTPTLPAAVPNRVL